MKKQTKIFLTAMIAVSLTGGGGIGGQFPDFRQHNCYRRYGIYYRWY